MRTIKRDIAGAFIFSKDDKILLGKKAKGGVYEDTWVVPGGGIDRDETKIQALKREIKEEVGLSLRDKDITEISRPTFGESRKTLPNGDEVLVKMTFWDFKVGLPLNAEEVNISSNSEFKEVKFFSKYELERVKIGDATETVLKEIGFIK